MKQSRKMSLVESLSNVAVGYFISVGVNALMLPLFDVHITMRNNLLIVFIFTVVSIVRSYVLRRVYEFIRVRQMHSEKFNESLVKECLLP